MSAPDLSSSLDPKKVCAFVAAGIATLLGLPWIMEFIDPLLAGLVKRLYPDFADFVYFLIQGGIYVMFFTLLQSVFYLAITSAIAAITAHALRFAL